VTPRLEAVYFDDGPYDDFARLARVLEHTADQHCGGWRRAITRLDPPRRRAGSSSMVANTVKLNRWCDLVASAEDGEQILLLDTDTALLRAIDAIWERPFDVAYATKVHDFQFNLGVFFLRVTARVRTLFETWRAENARLFRTWSEDPTWRTRYGGVNQASFGSLIQTGALEGVDVCELACAEWNCEESAWPAFDPAVTRILHLKGALRRSVFHRQTPPADLLPAVSAWRQLDRESRRGAKAAAAS